MKKYLRVKDAADILGINHHTIYRWIIKGGQYERPDFVKLCVLKIGKKILIKEEGLKKWIQQGGSV